MPTGIYKHSKCSEITKRKISKANSGEKHGNWKGGRPKCIKCGRILSRRGLRRCLFCYKKWRIGKNNSIWRGGLQIVRCLYCRKKFKVYPFRKETVKFCSHSCKAKYEYKIRGNKGFFFGKKHTEATKKILSILTQGEKSPMWQGGISKLPYPFGWTKTLKESIRQRDGCKCQLCGAPQIEFTRRLPVHHIDYNKDNLNPNNLITLCYKCNSKANFNREYWQMHFENKLRKPTSLFEVIQR